MYTGMMRPKGTYTIDVIGDSLEHIQELLEAERKDGYELVNSPAVLIKGGEKFSSTGTFERRDDVRKIEAETRDDLFALVPDGWQLLNIREA